MDKIKEFHNYYNVILGLFFAAVCNAYQPTDFLHAQSKVFKTTINKSVHPVFPLITDLTYCQSKNAQCGTLLKTDCTDSTVIQCGSCSTGDTCVANRCEPLCSPNDYEQPTDNLLAYFPIILNDDNIVQGSNITSNVMKTYKNTWVSNTDFSQKTIKLSIPEVNQNIDNASIAFYFIPSAIQNSSIITSSNFIISQISGAVRIAIKKEDGTQVVISSGTNSVKTTSCNHILININKNKVTLYFNGTKVTKSAGSSQFKTLPDVLKVGRFKGKLWDIRLYNRLFSDVEVGQLANKCSKSVSDTPYQQGYPNFLCGAYVCLWWPLDSDLDTGEEPIPLSQYQYYLKKQDEVFERNVVDVGMYPAGDLCGFMNWSKSQGNRNLVLSSNIRRTFVRPYSESDHPADQFWLHENFHSFQGNLSNYTHGEKQGSKFLLESTASWAADATVAGTPQAKDSLLGMYTLEPHVALWADQSSPIDSNIDSRFKGGHQYGAFIFFAYVSRYILNNHFIGDIFNDPRASSQPIAAANDLLANAGHSLKEIFADFAAKTINYDYLYTSTYKDSEAASCARMYGNDFDYNQETCIADSPKIIASFDENGTHCEWREPPTQFQIGSWAYNVYEVSSPLSQHFEVSVSIDSTNPTYTEFHPRLVVYNLTNNSYQYYEFSAMHPGDEQTMALTTPTNSKFYLVVVSTPDKFDGFETYKYRYKIKNIDN